jgi:serine/threonine-protein kinase
LFRLQHENVVRIWDANETPDGLFFIVMELLTGETMTQRLARGRIHPLRALKYGYDVACGLDAAHENRVVHRDVKPDNLFLTTDDVIKIIDFTAAKFFLAGLRTTEPDARVGTVAFMSPEHLAGVTNDARLDQYSLALCIYCWLRGRHAFEQHLANQFALMNAQAREMPEPLAKVAGLPSYLDDLLAPALAKKVDERYETMAVFGRFIHETMRRLDREEKAGQLVFDVPRGEPPIDLDTDGGARTSQQVYLAPEQGVRHTTAPIVPAERVSIAPDALPDTQAGDDTSFDSAVTAPLQPSAKAPAKTVGAHRTTTAPVPPMMTTAPAWPRPFSPRRLAPLALVLVLPAAGGLAWNLWPRPAASALPSAAPPTATAAPVPSTAPSAAEPVQPDAGAAASVSTPALEPPPRVAGAPRGSASRLDVPPQPRHPQGKAEPVLVEERAAAPAPATATAAASAAPAPAPTAAHRMFGTEN